jgi:hypothetical protein
VPLIDKKIEDTGRGYKITGGLGMTKWLKRGIEANPQRAWGLEFEVDGIGHISAGLFCKHSQVTFMPYRLSFKDERRTSNVQR